MDDNEKKPLLLATGTSQHQARGMRALWHRDMCPCIPARYVLAIIGFLGFVNVYALRVNLSMAILEMVNDSANASTHWVSSIWLFRVHVHAYKC